VIEPRNRNPHKIYDYQYEYYGYNYDFDQYRPSKKAERKQLTLPKPLKPQQKPG